MRTQTVLALLALATAALVWIGGSYMVRDHCLRRLGRPKPLTFDLDFSRNFPFRDYDAAERWSQLVIGLVTMGLGLLGSALGNGVFG